jgi:hypothetical protein
MKINALFPVFLILLLHHSIGYTQPFVFKSVNTAKPFTLTIGWQATGKAAYAWYQGQKEPITLSPLAYSVDSSERSSGQPDEETYKWTEIYKGKANGVYGLSVMNHNIYNAYYIRYSDHKKFELEFVPPAESFDGKGMALLHNTMLLYNVKYDDVCTVIYPDGIKKTLSLSSLPDGDNAYRYCSVRDYNFDGMDDIAFSVPDAGMGVYRFFDVFIYDTRTKRFSPLVLPREGNIQCEGFCDLIVDENKKQLQSSCRGGARWHTDTYRYDKRGRLKWIRSFEDNPE